MGIKRSKLRYVSYNGSAHNGTGRFIRQRITALANIPLTLFFVFFLARLLFTPSGDTLFALQSSGFFIALVLFLLVALWHMCIGMHAIITDYFQGTTLKRTLIVANIFYCWIIASIIVYSLICVLVFNF